MLYSGLRGRNQKVSHGMMLYSSSSEIGETSLRAGKIKVTAFRQGLGILCFSINFLNERQTLCFSFNDDEKSSRKYE